MTSARALLRSLVRPVYLPTFVYAVGVGAVAPATVLLGLRLGFTATQVAVVLAVGAVAGLAGALVSGPVVDRVGERTTLVVATGAGVAACVAVGVAVGTGAGAAPVLFVAAVLAVQLVDGAWSVARQSLLAERVPAGVRGRALNVYGAAQRLGRATGPALGALLVPLTGPVGSYALHALTSAVGCALIVQAVASLRAGPEQRAAASPVVPEPPSPEPPEPRRAPVVRPSWAAFWVVGAGMLALEALRTNRDLLVPLWGTGAVHLDERTVSLAVALGLGAELLLFLPAGFAVDRWGSLPVAIGCVAALTAGFTVLAAGGQAAFWAGTLVFGLGNGFGSGIVKTVGVQLAPDTGRATYLGRWTALSAVGALVGPGLVALTAGGAAEHRPAAAAVVATAVLGLLAVTWLATAGRRFLPRPR